jgi:trehalose 6-phosphate synthase
MNLVAKEYCACDAEERGVLVLSEFAGAAAQMHRHSILVNPHDIEGMGAAIHAACTMPAEERQRRMRRLRHIARRQDVFWWVDAFLDVALHRRLADFPVLEEELPQVRRDEAEF